MAILYVTDETGQEHTIETHTSCGSIMEVLLENGFDVGLCGGNCSCGTCCVAVPPDWLVRLPPAGENEMALTTMANNEFGKPRLSCQIPLSNEFDGIRLRIVSIE